MTEIEYTCKCKNQKIWISEGFKTKPCPDCGRVYIGIYKNYTIKAKEVNNTRSLKNENV